MVGLRMSSPGETPLTSGKERKRLLNLALPLRCVSFAV